MSLSSWRSDIATVRRLIAARTLGYLPSWRLHPAIIQGFVLTICTAALFAYLAKRGLEGCIEANPQARYAAVERDVALQTIPPGRSKATRFWRPGYKQLNCQEPQSEKEYEQCNQWYSAVGAAQQACINGLQFWVGGFIGILGLGGLFGTVVYAAKSAYAAGDAAEQMGRQVDAQVRFEQPVLIVGEIRPNFDGTRGFIAFDLLNAGKRPAILVHWTAECWGVQDFPSVPEYGPDQDSRDALISPEVPHPLQAKTRSKEESDRIWQYQVPAYFFGRFRYEDVFGKRRITGFCYRSDLNQFTSQMAIIRGEDHPHLRWRRYGGADYNYDREEASEPSSRT